LICKAAISVVLVPLITIDPLGATSWVPSAAALNRVRNEKRENRARKRILARFGFGY
jgi:hypothetical protein